MPNLLSSEPSPYLQQHKNNPVHWFPWGDAAFAKASRENKPVFLSIGYATCHWCHVMERESFENEATAEILNTHFVSIKVDREERPDIDRIYMSAVQAMGGQGGWPLSVFLTPDRKPFYGGTYFPPVDAYGRPGFPTLLHRIADVWLKESEDVLHSADELAKYLQQPHSVDARNTVITPDILDKTFEQIAAGYDARNGGFGTGTKFPRPSVFHFLFRYHRRTGNEQALSMSLTTLLAMTSGGMMDHLGGGFHRYSTDPEWRVPHFEKMLYDQAQLVHSYLDAFQITRDATFAEIARTTIEYVLRDLRTAEGAFASAEDADSAAREGEKEKKEGAFYIWSKEQIDAVLTPEESQVFCHHYSVKSEGNVIHDPHNEFRGMNILFNPFTIEQTATAIGTTPQRTNALLASARKKLFSARGTRPRPFRDDKVIVSWNGLMIGACARAASVLNEPSYRAAALTAAEFLWSTLYNEGKQELKRRYRNGAAGIDAQLDDYAFFASGLLEVYTATMDVRWLDRADALMGRAVTLFWDSAEGGFYDTTGLDASLIARTKETYDGAEPTGNAVAASVLMRLHRLLERREDRDHAERTIRWFCEALAPSPQVMPYMIAAAATFLSPPDHCVITTSRIDDAQPFLTVFASHFHPDREVIVMTPENRTVWASRLPFTAAMEIPSTGALAYVCRDFACHRPVSSPEDLVSALHG